MFCGSPLCAPRLDHDWPGLVSDDILPAGRHSQRAEYPLMEEYTLNHNIKAPII